MTTMLLLGAGIGAGLWLILIGLLPPRPSLADALATALAAPPPAPLVTGDDGGWVARTGRPAVGFLAGLGLPRARVRRDLAVLGRSPEQHLAEQAVFAVCGLVTPAAMALILGWAGLHVPVLVPFWCGLALAVVAFFTPDLGVRADANARRAEFRHALSAFLDLVVIALAGGAGVEAALDDAADIGTGWAADQIRRALAAARVARVPPWQILARLGDELDVPELAELAASVSLAGTEGAKVRTSLAAKAAALRAHQLTDAEGDAQAATERMSMPVVLLLGGFLAFIGFPAFAHVMTNL